MRFIWLGFAFVFCGCAGGGEQSTGLPPFGTGSTGSTEAGVASDTADTSTSTSTTATSTSTSSTSGATASATDSASTGTTGTTTGAKFDLGGGADVDTGGCATTGAGTTGGPDYEFSFIWIANTVQGTVSKIDTITGVEVARYRTGPDLEIPDPSRTSVNLLGDVAVSNRSGSIVKIVSRLTDCVEKNGMPGIQTSSGPNDVLSWGEDECVVWTYQTPSVTQKEGPRPTAWEGGNDANNPCAVANPRLWIGWYDAAGNKGVFERLNGASGTMLDHVEVPNWSGEDWGPYGGAVNKDGDLWALGWGVKGPIVRISAKNLAVDFHENPGNSWFYGLALDKAGNPWIGGCDGNVYHYDDGADAWSTIHTTPYCLRGLAIDTKGRAFIAANNGTACLVAIDTETKTVIDDNIQIPGCTIPVGVSIDVDGYVWVVDRGADSAYKIDPDTHQLVSTTSNLLNPYTYSDMTGAGLNLVVNPPQ